MENSLLQTAEKNSGNLESLHEPAGYSCLINTLESNLALKAMIQSFQATSDYIAATRERLLQLSDVNDRKSEKLDVARTMRETMNCIDSLIGSPKMYDNFTERGVSFEMLSNLYLELGWAETLFSTSAEHRLSSIVVDHKSNFLDVPDHEVMPTSRPLLDKMNWYVNEYNKDVTDSWVKYADNNYARYLNIGNALKLISKRMDTSSKDN